MSDKLGRPSLFDEKYTDELIAYFNIEPYEERTKQVATKSGEVIDIDTDVANDFPTLAGFAVKIGVHRDTLHEWSKAKNEDGSLKHPNFSDAYARAKDFQEKFLTVNGLKTLINPQFAMFVAKNVLGWRDKQPDETDVVVNNNISNLSDEELNAKIESLLRPDK